MLPSWLLWVSLAAAPAGPGTTSDRALLEAALEVSRRAVIERALAARLLAEARATRPDEALRAAEQDAADEEAARLRELRGRLTGAWMGTAALFSARWPIDPDHACRPQALALRQAMAASRVPLAPGRTARVAAMRCVERLSPLVARLREANRDLERAAAEARTALGRGTAPRAGNGS